MDKTTNLNDAKQAVSDFSNGIINHDPVAVSKGVIELNAIKNQMLADYAGAAPTVVSGLAVAYTSVADITGLTIAVANNDPKAFANAMADATVDTTGLLAGAVYGGFLSNKGIVPGMVIGLGVTNLAADIGSLFGYDIHATIANAIYSNLSLNPYSYNAAPFQMGYAGLNTGYYGSPSESDPGPGLRPTQFSNALLEPIQTPALQTPDSTLAGGFLGGSPFASLPTADEFESELNNLSSDQTASYEAAFSQAQAAEAPAGTSQNFGISSAAGFEAELRPCGRNQFSKILTIPKLIML